MQVPGATQDVEGRHDVEHGDREDAHDKLAMVQGTHFHWINLCNLCDFNHFLICTHCDETNCSRLGQRNSCCSFTSRNLYSTASYLVSECLLLLEGYHVR